MPDCLLTPIQLSCRTSKTRTGNRDMANRKPFRSRALKAEARHMAVRCQDGAYRTYVRKEYHDRPRFEIWAETKKAA